MKRLPILLLSFTLAACLASVYKVPVNPKIGPIGWGDPLAVRAALFIPHEDRDYVHFTSDNAAGIQVTLDVPIGMAIENAARDTYGQVFSNLATIRSLNEAGENTFVVAPEFMDLKYRWKGPDDQVTQTAIKVGFYRGSKKLWERIYPGREKAIGQQSRLDPDFARWEAMLGQTVSEGLAESLSASVNDFKSDGGLQRVVAELAGAPSRPATPSVIAAKPDSTVKTRITSSPLNLAFPQSPARPNDIAVIIGNADYSKQARDIPNVTPAYADAESFRRYALSALGVREGNIIFIKDATNANLLRVFGSDKDHRGQLYDWVVAGESRIWVYYAGHGAPAGKSGSSYLVPTDADASRIQLNGYALATLYNNLGRLPAKSVTVVLEACFSGASQTGSVINAASGIYVRPKAIAVPAGVTVIAAGAPDEIASWEEDKSHGLFTKYFLTGMSGDADNSPYGDGDGQVTYPELDRYLKKTMTYFARRYYGRDQTAQIVVGKSG